MLQCEIGHLIFPSIIFLTSLWASIFHSHEHYYCQANIWFSYSHGEKHKSTLAFYNKKADHTQLWPNMT